MRLVLGLLLLASLALNAWMVTWGLPSTTGWAPDEILPSAVLEARARGFSNGWHDKYPPLHFRLLSGLYSPMLAGGGASVPTETYHRLFLAGRLLTVAMGVGCILLVFLCGRRVLDERKALIAAAIVTVMAPFVFYAKLANVDVPYLFWWLLSLLFLLRALDDHRLVDYLALGGDGRARGRHQGPGVWAVRAGPATAGVVTSRPRPREGLGTSHLCP